MKPEEGVYRKNGRFSTENPRRVSSLRICLLPGTSCLGLLLHECERLYVARPQLAQCHFLAVRASTLQELLLGSTRRFFGRVKLINLDESMPNLHPPFSAWQPNHTHISSRHPNSCAIVLHSGFAERKRKSRVSGVLKRLFRGANYAASL